MADTPSILFIATVSQTLSSFLLPLAQALRERGWRVDAMAGEIKNHRGLAACFDQLWEIPFSRRLGRASLSFIPNLLRIRGILLRSGYDILHAHTPFASFIARLAVATLPRAKRPRVIYTAHGFSFHEGGGRLANLAFFRAEKLAARWTDTLIVMNEEDYQAAAGRHLISAEKIRRLPGIGVDASSFDPARFADTEIARKRDELGLPDGAKVFVMAAEFIPRKRHIDAIEAMRLLPAGNVFLLFAGTGRLEDAMKQEVATRGLEGAIRFLGLRDDVPELLALSDAVVLVSVQEGLPRVLLEALSLNAPAISTDIRGSRELLADGRGILVPVRSPERLAEAMVWILEHPDEARRMGEKGREIILARYDDPVVLARQLEIIDETLR